MGKKKGKEIKETGNYIEWGDGYDVYEGIEFVFNDKRSWLDRLLHGDKDYSHEACELMWKHQEFYRQVREVEAEYAERGAVLWCTHGSKPTKLDECTGHGISVNGNEVMTCNSNTVDENIFSFGACGNGLYEPLYSEDAPHPAELAKDGIHYRCVPILLREWGYGGINERSDKPGIYIAEPRIDAPQLEGYLQHDDEYVEALLTEYNLLCLYGGVITIEENPEIEEEIKELEEIPERKIVMLAPWLIAYEGQPEKRSESDIEITGENNLKINERNRIEGRDWYSYEDKINENADKQYNKKGKILIRNYLYADENNMYGLVNEDNRYWVAVGPEILHPGYNKKYSEKEQDLNESQFEYGTEIDVILEKMQSKENLEKGIKAEPFIYIECIVGDVKGHTYPYGLFQTGEAYPESPNAKQDGSMHKNGSYIEFMSSPLDENGDPINGEMSDYIVKGIIVHKREW